MTINLFKGIINNEGINLEINTYSEWNVLIDFLINDKYREIDINGHRFNRWPDKDGTVVVDYTNDSGDFRKIRYQKVDIINQLNGTNLSLDYSDAGCYSAIGYDRLFYTTLEIEGKSYNVVLPTSGKEEDFADSNMCRIYGLGCCKGMGGRIVAKLPDEACYYVYNFRLRIGEYGGGV